MTRKPIQMVVNEMDQILKGDDTKGSLWIGNVRAAQNVKGLLVNNINTIITVANNIKLDYSEYPQIRHKIFSIADKENVCVDDLLEDTNREIEEGLKYGSVLVHCFAGISRSATCVIAYMIKSLGWSYEKTFYFIKEIRGIINPNPGFKRQLVEYGKRLQMNRKFHSHNQTKDLSRGMQGRLHHQLNQQDLKQQLSTLLKSPGKKITNLTRDSTCEEKQIYRQQLAQKMFMKTFSPKQSFIQRDISQHTDRDQQPHRIKAFLSIYKKIDPNGYQSERLQ